MKEEGTEEERRGTLGAASSKRGPNTTGWLGTIEESSRGVLNVSVLDDCKRCGRGSGGGGARKGKPGPRGA
eukprot:5658966-Pyramimonas_sp.AAC.1